MAWVNGNVLRSTRLSPSYKLALEEMTLMAETRALDMGAGHPGPSEGFQMDIDDGSSHIHRVCG